MAEAARQTAFATDWTPTCTIALNTSDPIAALSHLASVGVMLR
jgi:hypothetical protein